MRAGDILSLLIGVGLIVFYFAEVLPSLGPWFTSPVIVALYWVVVAVFIAPPTAKLLGENLVRFVFGEKGGKNNKGPFQSEKPRREGKVRGGA